MIEAGELEVDDHGRIWRLGWSREGKDGERVKIRCGRRRAERKTPSGYLQLAIYRGDERYYPLAHRLVFHVKKGPIPDGLCINHINGVKSDNRPDNLEAVTYKENTKHAREALGVRPRQQNGEANSMSALTAGDVVEIRRARAAGVTLRELSERFSVAFQTVSAISLGKRWAHVGGPLTRSKFGPREEP